MSKIDRANTPCGTTMTLRRRGVWLAVMAAALAGGLAAWSWGIRPALAAAMFRQAAGDMRRGAWSGALDWAERGLWYESQKAGWLLRGEALVGLGRFLEAAESFDRVPEMDDSPFQVRLARVQAWLGAGRLSAVEAELLRLVAQYPGPGAHRDELRWLYFNQMRTRDVERLLLEALAREPQNGPLLVDLLQTEFRRQIPLEIAPYFERLEAQSPGDPLVRLALARCAWTRGRLEEAWDSLARSRSAGKHLEQDWLELDWRLETGDWQRARELIAVLETAAANDDRTHGGRGRLCLAERKWGAAIQAFEEALRRRPDDTAWQHGQASALQQMGQHEACAALRASAAAAERATRELRELVLSGAIDRLTPSTAKRIMQLERARGRTMVAEAWARQIQPAAGDDRQ